MKRHLCRIALSNEAAAGLIDAGFATRERALKELLGSAEATLNHYWFTSGGEVFMVLETPDSVSQPLRAMRTLATGLWSRPAEIIEILTAEEMDEALANDPMAPVRLPGSE